MTRKCIKIILDKNPNRHVYIIYLSNQYSLIKPTLRLLQFNFISFKINSVPCSISLPLIIMIKKYCTLIKVLLF